MIDKSFELKAVPKFIRTKLQAKAKKLFFSNLRIHFYNLINFVYYLSIVNTYCNKKIINQRLRIKYFEDKSVTVVTE